MLSSDVNLATAVVLTLAIQRRARPCGRCVPRSRPGSPAACTDVLLKARLFAAFGLEILWNKPGQQVTVFAEITENTLQAIPAITDPGQDGYHDTSTQTSTGDTAPCGIWATPLDPAESHTHRFPSTCRRLLPG
jgi:hypothetical protein